MRITSRISGIVLLFVGGVWFLQGINILPGSFMTGQARWAIYGALLVITGVALLMWTKRRRS
jgi:hypothetical protein